MSLVLFLSIYGILFPLDLLFTPASFGLKFGYSKLFFLKSKLDPFVFRRFLALVVGFVQQLELHFVPQNAFNIYI